MLRKEIGLRIKNIRLNMNITKQKMAELLGISGQYLGMIERGEGTLSIDKLKVLCDILLGYLLIIFYLVKIQILL